MVRTKQPGTEDASSPPQEAPESDRGKKKKGGLFGKKKDVTL